MHTMTRQLRLFLAALGIALICASCSSQQVKPSRASAPSGYSGFLANYDLLRADPSDPDYLRYLAPDLKPTEYRKFLIEAPAIIINTGGQYQMLDPAQLADLTRYYQASMASALGKHYEVVSEPGPGVMRLKVAVVGLVEVMPRLKARDLIPVSALFKLGRMAVGQNPLVLRMSIESEALDAQTGELLGEAVDSRESSKTVTKGKPASSDQLHELIDFWVHRFVARLDKANGFKD